MKILLINDFKNGGGAEVVFLQTYKTLKEMGLEVDLLYCHDKITPPTSVISYLFSNRNYRKLYKRLTQKRYDLVYILNYAYAFSPSILLAVKKYKKQNHNVKVIYNAHDAHIICPNSVFAFFKKKQMHLFPSAPRVREFIFKRLDYRGVIHSVLKKIQWLLAYRLFKLYNVFDEILCPSIFLCSKIQETYPKAKVSLLRNPLELDNIAKLRIYNKNISNAIKIVYFGRISQEKGLKELIENLKDIDYNYVFYIYGDGPELPSLKILIDNLQLGDKIFLKGKKQWNELMTEISQYDAFILPSLIYENAPCSIVEAAAAGLYVITMKYGGLEELASLVGNSYLINPITPDTLKKSFEFVRNNQFNNPNLEIFSIKTFKTVLLSHIYVKKSDVVV